MYDFQPARDEIGYLPYDNITSLHIRVDKWGLRLLQTMKELKEEKDVEHNKHLT